MEKFDLGKLDEVVENGYTGQVKREFKENALKYKAESGATVATINPSKFISVIHNSHRVKVGKYFALVACHKEVGKPCPICAKMTDAWNMANKLVAETTEGLPADKKEEARKKILKEQIDIVAARAFEKTCTYVYAVTAKLRNVVLTRKKFEVNEKFNYTFEDGTTEELPAFDIKVQRISTKALQKLRDDFKMNEEDINGGVLVTVFPETTDNLTLGRDKKINIIDREVVSNVYPRLQEAIDAEVKKVFNVGEDGELDFDILVNVFPELDKTKVETLDIEGIASNVLGNWYDFLDYQKENPDATYIAYKEGKGNRVENVPNISLDADKDTTKVGAEKEKEPEIDSNGEDAIASATPIEDDSDLPF